MRAPRLSVPGVILTALGLLALLMAMLLTFVEGVGTDGELLYRLQVRHGADERNMAALDGALAEYLRGDEGALSATGAFNDRELYHMADVFRLFALLRTVRAALLAAAATFCALGLAMHGPGRCRMARRAALIADGVLALAVGALALWAVSDFTGLFTAFHRLLFTNELWMLDPSTDVLIRICPEGMFRDMAARIALYTLAFAACLPLLAEIPDCFGRVLNGLRMRSA